MTEELPNRVSGEQDQQVNPMISLKNMPDICQHVHYVAMRQDAPA